MDDSAKIHWTDNSELVELYVLNRIESPQRAKLDLHLAECSQCRKRVDRERQLAAGIRLAGRDMLKSNLRKRLQEEETSAPQRYQFISLVAAVLVIFIGLGLFRFYTGSFEWPSKFSHKQIILKNSASDSDKIVEREEEPAKLKEDKSVVHEQAAPTENGMGGSLSGSGVQGQSGLSDLESRDRMIQRDDQTRSFWLLGTVTMIHDSEEAKKLSAERSDEPLRKETSKSESLSQDKRLIVKQGGIAQAITLTQRPSNALPTMQQRKAVGHEVQTLVEKTTTELRLTLYRDNLLTEYEIQQATIEPITSDSLVVHLANEHIMYHIPGGWSVSQTQKIDDQHR